MKTLSHLHVNAQENPSKGWRHLINSAERWLMQRNSGKTTFSRQIRCRTKILLIRLFETTY
jgi:hypothetical protein